MKSASPYRDAEAIQKKLAAKVRAYDDFKSAEIFCGVDVSYIGDQAYPAAAVMNLKLELLELRTRTLPVRYPYVPGYFMLREGPPVKKILSKIRTGYDILLIDGHGISHPRHCGLASYIGVTLDTPTIGVAKSLLCGTMRNDNFVEYDGDILGYAVNQGNKTVYVSTGHRVSLETAVNFVRAMTKPGQSLPEPLRIADTMSKQKKREELRP